MKRVQESYDLIPYPSLSYTETHPDRLATLATLLGLEPAPVADCKVLELGCAVGGNLIPMAEGLPGSFFVGIDNSTRQIEMGREAIEAIGLENITLMAMDILEIDRAFGKFDYIIAHGIYSWVPEPVREKVLSICHDNLSPDGVAYISYNTLPGWHMLRAIRDMLLYHTRTITDPYEKGNKARAFIKFLAEALPGEDHIFGSFVKTYAELLKKQNRRNQDRSSALLLHDELEAVNEPQYFSDFIDRARAHGMQYLTEADFPSVMVNNFSPSVADQLLTLATDLIDLEQNMDFLRNRTFRKTLLCHEGLKVNRSLTPDPAMMSKMYIASRVRLVDPQPDVQNREIATYEAPDGAKFSTDHPVTKAAFQSLANRSPQAILFPDLVAQALRVIYGDGVSDTDLDRQGQDRLVLAANLLQAFSYSLNLIELHVHSPAFVIQPSETPTTSPFARYQVARGETVTNQRHERVNLDSLTSYLLPWLDGKHDRDDLAEILAANIESLANDLPPGKNKTSPIDEILSQTLNFIGRAGLLLA